MNKKQTALGFRVFSDLYKATPFLFSTADQKKQEPAKKKRIFRGL